MSKNAKLFNKAGKDYRVSSSYGQRNLIVNGKDISGYHIGTDYLFPQGTELVLPVDVEIIGVNTGHSDYGGHVFAYSKELDGTFHPSHMSRIDVKKGDIVKAGTVIGLSGGARGTHGAGTSTGAHLHIGWYAKGKKTNTGKGKQGDGQWIDIEKVDFTLKVEEVKSDKAFIKKGAKSKSLSAKYNNLSIANSAIGVPLDYELNKVKGKDWVYFPSIQTYVDIKDVDFTLKVVEKTVDELAQEVIDGKWGNGQERVNRLTKAGHDSKKVQSKVNEILKVKPKPVSNVGKTAQLRGKVNLYPNSTGGTRYIPSGRSRNLKILDEANGRLKVKSTAFNPQTVWVNKKDVKVV